MRLYDIFYKGLESSNDVDKAIELVEKEILKRRASTVKSEHTDYEYLKKQYEKIMKLKKKSEFYKLDI